jgi:hypothetical protein
VSALPIGKGFTVTLDDLRDKGIDRSTNYLQKVAGLDLHGGSQEWLEIKKIQNIRNAIVHRAGKLRGDPAVIKWVNELESLSLDDEGEIVVGKGFLSHVIHTYATCFETMLPSRDADVSVLRPPYSCKVAFARCFGSNQQAEKETMPSRISGEKIWVQLGSNEISQRVL